MANGQQLLSNSLSNDRFLPIQLAGKKRGGLDKSIGVKARANSSVIVLFFLLFNLINFYLCAISVTTNVKKADNLNIDVVDAVKLSKSKTDLAKTGKPDKPGTSIATTDPAKIDGVNKSDTSPV